MGLKETYNRIAENWHRDHSHDDWWVEGTDAFVAHLSKGGSILDVGCGSGVKSKYLLAKGFSVTGIDISENLLNIAKREAPQGTYYTLSMGELDSLPEKFDGVFAQASLLHIPRDRAGDVVKQMANRLNQGGVLYIAVKEARKGGELEQVVKENDYGFEYERFFSYFFMEELEKYFSDAGLSVILKMRNPSPSGKTTWLQILGKRC